MTAERAAARTSFLASVPERTIRAGAALLGGLVNETAHVLLPGWLRGSKLYQATVERLLRITIELVGDVQGVFPEDTIAAKELLARKAAGNVVELASFLATGWSPLWLLAAASDLLGGTKVYLQALVSELRTAGALRSDTDVGSFAELLTALEGASGVLADAIDVPPLNVAGLRHSWQELQAHVEDLPEQARLAGLFDSLQQAARREGRSLLQISAIVGLGAVRAGAQMGNVFLFDYYRQALTTIVREGLAAYLRRVSRPYLRRAVAHFDPRAATITDRAIRRWRARRIFRRAPRPQRVRWRWRPRA